MRLTSHFRNIFFLYSGDVVSRLISMTAIVYLARILGPSDFGTLNIGLAVLAYGMIVGNSGLSVLGTRKVAGKVESVEDLTANIFVGRFLLSSAAYGVGIVVVCFFSVSNGLFRLISIYLLGVFPAAFLLDWFFHGNQKLKIVAVGQLAGMICYLLIVLCFVKTSEHMVWIAWAWIVGMWVNTLFLWMRFRLLKYSLHFDLASLRVRSLLMEAFPLGVATLIAQLVTQFPPIYLGIVSTRADVGLFSAAYKFILFLLIFDRIFYAIFFPNISRCFKQSPERLEENVNHVLKLTTGFVLLVGLIAVISSGFFVRLIFGDAFLDAVPIFQVMVGLFVLKLINSVFTFTLIGIEQEKIYTKSLIFGLSVFLVMLALCTRPLGSIGVVMALIGFEIASLTVMIFSIKHHVAVHVTRNVIMPFMGTVCLSMVFLFYIDVFLLIKLLLAFIIGLPVIIWLGGFGLDEIRYLRRIFI